MAKVVNDPVSDSANKVKTDTEVTLEQKLQNLKDAANIFLQNVHEIYNNVIDKKIQSNHIVKLKKLSLEEMLKKNPKDLLNIIIGKNLDYAENERSKILDQIFIFQKAINEFLNIDTIKMVYVDEDGTLYEFTENIEKNMLRAAGFKDGKFVSLSLTGELKKIIAEQGNIKSSEILKSHNEIVVNLYQKIMKQEDQDNFKIKNIENRKDLLPTLYKQRRGIRKKNEEGKRIETYNTDFFLVTMENEEMTFKHMKNLGILKEAYVAALYDKKSKITDAKNEGANQLYEHYIKKVDNTYGIFGGDVSIKIENSKSQDLAIKSGSFNSENYNQLISFAKYVLLQLEDVTTYLKNIENQNNTDILKQFISNFSGAAAKINGSLNKKAADKLQKDLKKKLDITVSRKNIK